MTVLYGGGKVPGMASRPPHVIEGRFTAADKPVERANWRYLLLLLFVLIALRVLSMAGSSHPTVQSAPVTQATAGAAAATEQAP